MALKVSNNFHPPTDIARELRVFFVDDFGKKMDSHGILPPPDSTGLRICGWADTEVVPFPATEKDIGEAVYRCLGSEHVERYASTTVREWIVDIHSWSIQGR